MCIYTYVASSSPGLSAKLLTLKTLSIMSKHLLEIKDLENFQSKTQIAGAFGNGNNKSLNIVTTFVEDELYSYFTMEVSRQEQLQTPYLDSAIKEYNHY